MWVMNSDVSRRPWMLTFRIGAVIIARIWFVDKKPFLFLTDAQHGPFDSVGEAMTKMHELLNSPPPVDLEEAENG